MPSGRCNCKRGATPAKARACVVRRETTLKETQNRTHSGCEEGPRKKEEAEEHLAVDEPGPDVCDGSTRAAIDDRPAARVHSQDPTLLTIPTLLPNQDDDVPVSPPPAGYLASSQILYAIPSPSLSLLFVLQASSYNKPQPW